MAGKQQQWSAPPGFWSTIGARTIKYTSWGDGFDEARLVNHGEASEESFTVWYGLDGVCVGVLTHNYDRDYEEGRKLVEAGEPLPV